MTLVSVKIIFFLISKFLKVGLHFDRSKNSVREFKFLWGPFKAIQQLLWPALLTFRKMPKFSSPQVNLPPPLIVKMKQNINNCYHHTSQRAKCLITQKYVNFCVVKRMVFPFRGNWIKIITFDLKHFSIIFIIETKFHHPFVTLTLFRHPLLVRI